MSAARRSKPAPISALVGNNTPARLGWLEKPRDQKVTVVIPVLNESARVASVVKLARIRAWAGHCGGRRLGR
jgi:hypothetical protein